MRVQEKEILTKDGKVCTDCKEWKPLSSFYSKGERVESFCKECSKLRRKKRYAKGKKQQNEQTKRRVNNKVIDIKKFKVVDKGLVNEKAVQELLAALLGGSI